MKKQRIVALGLTAILAFNSSIPAFALEEHRQEKLATVKTAVKTADVLPDKLIPLSSESTTMLDNGDTLRNADGEADTEIQETYHQNQTLVSSSLAGTSFSFMTIRPNDLFLDDTPEPLQTHIWRAARIFRFPSILPLKPSLSSV